MTQRMAVLQPAMSPRLTSRHSSLWLEALRGWQPVPAPKLVVAEPAGSEESALPELVSQ